MDNILLDYIVNQFKAQSGVDIRNDKVAYSTSPRSRRKSKDRTFNYCNHRHQLALHCIRRIGPQESRDDSD